VRQSAGAAQPNISKVKIVNTVAPLPPLAEQKRIVAKVDELMRLCDELEARRKATTENCVALNASCLNALTTPHSCQLVPATAKRSEDGSIRGSNPPWQRIADNFDVLYDNPQNVGELRKTILQLAVQGRLVPQDPNDEPAAVLLERIVTEKERLVRDGKIRECKPLLAIDPRAFPRILPRGWEWVRLGEVQVFTNGFAFKSTDYQPTGVGIIRMGELGADENIDESSMKYVSRTIADSLPDALRVRPGALLMGMSGSIGKLAINRTDQTYLLNQRVGRLDPVLIAKGYLFAFLKTVEQLYLDISFGMAIKNLSTKQINETLAPLPPLAEQRRIVTKVDELMRLCDALESRLTQSQADAESLMAAVVHHLSGQQEEAV